MRVAVLAFAILLVVPSTVADWRSFHNDERNTGTQTGAYAVYEDVWWNTKLTPATQVESSLIVASGLVIVTDWLGNVRVLDAESGAQKWTAVLTKIVGTPAVSSTKLFVVDTAGTMKAFDLSSGTVLGSAAVGATLASPKIHEGKIFIGNEAGEMKAYDTETLTLLWKFAVSSIVDPASYSGNSSLPCPTTAPIPTGQIRGAPAIYQGKVIFGSMNHWVYAIHEQGQPGQTTLPQWAFKTNDIVVNAPSIDHANQRVIVGSYDEKVYSLPASPAGSGPRAAAGNVACSTFGNTPGWTFSVPDDIGQSKVHSSPAVEGGRVYFGANNGRVYAVYTSNATKAWEYTTGDVVISSPAVANGHLVVGSDDGKVYWLNTTTGELEKSFSAGSAVKSSPAIDGERAFVATFEGHVYMFGPKIPLRPDFIVASITYDGTQVSVIVTNQGTGNSTAASLRLKIDGSLVEDFSMAVIEAGASSVFRHNVDLDPGAYTIEATADHALVVPEIKEDNNAKTQTILVDEPSKKGGKGGIPGPSLVLVAVALALVAANRRRSP